MSTSGSSTPSIPFKSKKPLQSTTKSKSTDLIATQTPDKPPAKLPPRLRNRRVALSVKDVREVAQGIRDGLDQKQADLVAKSARRQISSSPDDSTSVACKSESAAAGEPAKLPAKYEMLGEFFDCLDSSIRLLRLKRSISSLTNISRKIECLSDRRFSHRHLAQLKYIMPEVIEAKRVLVLDERTSCMKPELHVSINVDAIEFDGNLQSTSRNLQLRKIFRSRIADFYKAHPQGDEIPEELLPEPFNRSNQAQDPNSSSSTETSTDAHVGPSHKAPLPEKQQPAVASHFSRCFRRHFSQRSTPIEPVNTQQNAGKWMQSLNKISSDDETSCAAPSPTHVSPSYPLDDHKCSSDSDVSADMRVQCVTATPHKEIDSLNSRDTPKDIASIHSTPAKLVLTPSTSSRTPALHPQKRCYMSPDDPSTFSENKLVRRPLVTRSLKFETPSENVVDEVNNMEDVSTAAAADDDDDVLSILPKSLLQSIRETERKTREERDPAISQAKRRRQMIACLPKLFNTIHFLIQSIKRSVITKQELMHKIIASNYDIVDSREVEEQLNLLLELAPEWISQKLTCSGDLLFRINKMSSADTIRACLEEAK
ncbi:CDT1-like protein a, chloroplastic [Euphorbia lathyris]|uniref:CDT1-like protein a, chloroplastic n=1 Tax=Euphorbia lathyris TaxID=212925 RepID=UPI0033132876